jgi:hypothetical protein
MTPVTHKAGPERVENPLLACREDERPVELHCDAAAGILVAVYVAECAQGGEVHGTRIGHTERRRLYPRICRRIRDKNGR